MCSGCVTITPGDSGNCLPRGLGSFMHTHTHTHTWYCYYTKFQSFGFTSQDCVFVALMGTSGVAVGKKVCVWGGGGCSGGCAVHVELHNDEVKDRGEKRRIFKEAHSA